MNAFISFFCIIFGICFIIYGGWISWEMLITGIVTCVDGAKVNPTEPIKIAKGVLMIICCAFPFIVGVISSILCFRAGINPK